MEMKNQMDREMTVGFFFFLALPISKAPDRGVFVDV